MSCSPRLVEKFIHRVETGIRPKQVENLRAFWCLRHFKCCLFLEQDDELIGILTVDRTVDSNSLFATIVMPLSDVDFYIAQGLQALRISETIAVFVNPRIF